MAKNIVIAEGGTAKNFTAKKIQTKLQGSGTCNWVPEDEAVDYVDLKDKTFTAPGTYKPSDFNCDGFGEIKVDIPSNVKEKTITKNGIFYAADDGCLGYSKVTVAVPEGGGGGPYKVNFFGDDYETILKTEANVPYGGSASCTDLDGTVLNGLYFKGWNPQPSNVRGDMNCYPVRGDYIIDGNEIQDSWETICADGGAHYPLGSYKALVLTAESSKTIRHSLTHVRSNNYQYYDCYRDYTTSNISVSMHMVKVAEGEDGSSSTWLSTGAIYIPTGILGNNSFMSGFYTRSDGQGSMGTVDNDWGSSFLRQYLNSIFLESLPTCIQETVKEVNKEFGSWNYAPSNYVYGNQGASKVYKTSLDKIWIPSMKELHTLFASTSNYASYSQHEEPNGIDYTGVYVPTYNAQVYTRTRLIKPTTMKEIALSADKSSVVEGGDNNAYVPFGFCL